MSSQNERAAYWSALVAEHRASGRPTADWCRTKGVSFHSFSAWRTRLNKESSADGGWVTVKAQPITAKASSLTLFIGTVRFDVAPGFDQQLLRDVVAALQPPC